MRARLQEYIKYLGLTNRAFCRKVGIGENTLNCNKGIDLSKNTLDKIANTYPQLNINWIITGEGEMIMENDRDIIYRLINIIENKDRHISKLIHLLEKKHSK